MVKAAAIVIKIFNIIMGGLLITLSVFRFISASKLRFVQTLLTVYYVYVYLYILYMCIYRLFALILILSEFPIEFIHDMANFQEGLMGKGFFMIFIGILCFDVVGGVKE